MFEHIWKPCSKLPNTSFRVLAPSAPPSTLPHNVLLPHPLWATATSTRAKTAKHLTVWGWLTVHMNQCMTCAPQCNLESRPFYAIFPFSQSYWLHSFNMLQPIAVCRASEKDGVSLPRALLQINTGSSQTWQCFWSDCIGHANRHQSAQIQQDVRVLESSQRNVAPFQVLVTLTSRPPNHAGVPRIPPASQQHAAAVSVASESRWSCWTPSLQGQPNWVCLKMLCA